MRFFGNAVEQANIYARNNPEFKQDVYRALYENLKRLAEEKKEELAENDGTIEGDQGLASGQ